MANRCLISVIIVGVLALIAVWLITKKNTKSNYQYLPSQDIYAPYYFQNLPPSLHVEDNYHSCIMKRCKGNYEDYKCRQQCYVLAMKDGTYDRADYVCANRGLSQSDYLDCLDMVYGNYIGHHPGIDGIQS